MLLDRKRIRIALIFVPFLLVSCLTANLGLMSSSSDLSPYSFGLAEAKTGLERYQVILKTHEAAIQKGVNVDYRGIKTIEIEIPKKASRIPLTRYNDFHGCTFVIKNRQTTVYLFEAQEKSEPIQISKRDIDAGDFRRYLGHGKYLVLIEDRNPWVNNRKGFSYGHQRRDILLIKDGFAQNKTIMPYNNKESDPECKVIPAENTSIVIKNLTINRTADSKAITNIFYITGKCGVSLSNFSLHTPENDWRNDRAVRIDDCTNIHFENVSIDGTYSRIDHSGYGISFDNVWNFTATNLVGRGTWGVFGTNNVNKASIKNSRINRFDIHCYGRDVTFNNVDFFDRYNQFCSVYGDIVFEHCSFTNFDPVRNGGSYNAYVKHNIFFVDCVFNVSKSHNCLLRMGALEDEHNKRKELSEKCWPNVYIKNLTVNMDKTCSDVIVFYTMIKDDVEKIPIEYISTINIDGFTINSPNENIRLLMTSKSIKTREEVKWHLQNFFVNGERREPIDPVDKSDTRLIRGRVKLIKRAHK